MRIKTLVTGESRGQAYMTEAILAIILLSAVLVSASSTVGVTESAIDVEQKQTQTNIESDIEGILELTLSNGELKASLLNWNANNYRYNDYTTYQTTEGLYLDYPDDDLGNRLRRINNRYDREVNFAIEVVPANTTTPPTTDLENVEPKSEVPISTNSTTTTTVVAAERYMTIYTNDTLRSDPEVYTTIETPALPDEGKSTVEQAYTNEMDERGEPDNIYFPLKPRKEHTELSEGDVWNVYRVRLIAWF